MVVSVSRLVVLEIPQCWNKSKTVKLTLERGKKSCSEGPKSEVRHVRLKLTIVILYIYLKIVIKYYVVLNVKNVIKI